jgi:hypothetical protein
MINEKADTMCKVHEGSADEYLRFDRAREHALPELDVVIRAAAPTLSRSFVPATPPGQPGMTMKMIGYGGTRIPVSFLT